MANHGLSWGRITEFIVIGIIAGIIEDLIAVYAVAGVFDWTIVLIVTIITIPFAVVSELIVDHFKPFHSKKSRLHEINHQQKLLEMKYHGKP